MTTRYILLNENDVVEAGDEYLEWDPDDYVWRKISNTWIGQKVPSHITYRRRINSCRYCGHDPLSTED